MSEAVEPSVYLVSKPDINYEAVNEFLADEGCPIATESIRSRTWFSGAGIVEIAARLCYMSFGKGRKDPTAFFKNILESKHGSVLEHVNYGFIITGVSRSLTHELVRHRAGFAFSQRSQRYVDESDANFIIPPELPVERHEGFETDLKSSIKAYEFYCTALEMEGKFSNLNNTDKRKAIRQASRSLLPNAVETKIFVTANVRAWRHFIELRGSLHADAEIRRLALIILELLQSEAPMFFADFSTFSNGTGKWTEPEYSKV